LEGEGRAPGEGVVEEEIFGQQQRHQALHAEAHGHAREAAGEAQQRRLQRVDDDDLRAARTQAFHDRDGVQTLLHVGVDGGGDAQRADHQRDQADQAEERRRTLQRAPDGGVRLAVIGNHGFGKNALEIRAQGVDRDRLARARRRQAEQETLRRAAAEGQQARAFEAGAADEHTRPDVQAAGHAVGLADDRAGDAELGRAELDQRAGLHIQPHQQIVGDGHAVLVERLLQRLGWIEHHLAIKGIHGRVDGLDGNQHRHAARGAHHGHRLGDASELRAALHVAVEALLLRGRQRRELAQAHVGGHQRARLAPQLFLKRVGKTAHAGQRADARGHAEYRE
jgi:hypothetical protein